MYHHHHHRHDGVGESEGEGGLLLRQQQGNQSPASKPHRYHDEEEEGVDGHHHHMTTTMERNNLMAQQRHHHNHLMMPKDVEMGSATMPHHHHPMDSSTRKRRRGWNCFRGANKLDTGGTLGRREQKQRRRQQQPRLVDKNGECIIRPNNLRDSFSICLRNWFHLVIEHSWRCIFLLFASGFLLSWLTFGLLYYFIQHFSGDMQNLAEQRQCIANVHSLTSAFLFSLESQHTIGYGTRYMTEMCPLAYATLSLQCIVGVLLQTILAGIVIAKILRPKKRKQEMRFSTHACIGPVDDEDQRPALMIRLADIQHRLYIAESHVRLYMATTKINKNGGCELIGVQDMNVGYDTGMDRVLLLWPVVIRHIIDQDSPLWEITEEKLHACQFELIMTVEGIVEATGMAFQARTSFLPNEILWAQRFVPLISLNPRSNQFEVDYDLFDVTESHSLELWLPPEEEDQEEVEMECCAPATTKLSVISELDGNAVAAIVAANGTIVGGGGHHQHHHQMPNGTILPPPADQQLLPPIPPPHNGQFRRKSTCSIADSIRSGKFACGTAADEIPSGTDLRPAPRKTSRSSLLHVLLRRTQTNDSSPLVSNNNICAPGSEDGGGGGGGVDGSGGGGTLSPGPDGNTSLSCSPLPPMPASPFVVHTLQHSGFT